MTLWQCASYSRHYICIRRIFGCIEAGITKPEGLQLLLQFHTARLKQGIHQDPRGNASSDRQGSGSGIRNHLVCQFDSDFRDYFSRSRDFQCPLHQLFRGMLCRFPCHCADPRILNMTPRNIMICSIASGEISSFPSPKSSKPYR